MDPEAQREPGCSCHSCPTPGLHPKGLLHMHMWTCHPRTPPLSRPQQRGHSSWFFPGPGRPGREQSVRAGNPGVPGVWRFLTPRAGIWPGGQHRTLGSRAQGRDWRAGVGGAETGSQSSGPNTQYHCASNEVGWLWGRQLAPLASPGAESPEPVSGLPALPCSPMHFGETKAQLPGQADGSDLGWTLGPSQGDGQSLMALNQADLPQGDYALWEPDCSVAL